jgi:hypothetical protein
MVAGALLLWCCEQPRSEPAQPASPHPSISAEAAPAPAVSAPRHLAHTDGCQATDGKAQPIAEKRELPADAQLVLEREGTCKLLYSAGALVRLYGPARVMASPHGEAGLLVREGTLELDLSHGALTATSGFWFALPSARVELVQGARLVARAFPGGASELYVVSGSAKVQGAASARGTLLSAGRGLSVSAQGEARALTQTLEKLEAARAWMLARSPGKPPADVLAAMLPRFSQALAAAEAQAAQGKALLERHRGLPQGAPEAMTLQRELSVQQAEALRLARIVSGQADSLAAWLLDPALDRRAELEPLLVRARALRH